MLPGIDDGAGDLDVSLQMARAAVEQGITVVACTPHILPGLYHNSGPAIRQAVRELQAALDDNGIPLQVTTGADVHMAPDFVAGLRSGRLLSIADSRYVPILTHPERLSWVPSRYQTIKKLVQSGVWMQVTAGSFAGAFGRNPLYWAERMLDEGRVHLIATDAHDAERRRPDLAAGRELAAKRVGAAEAERLVLTRPLGILRDEDPSSLPGPSGVADADTGSYPDEAGQARRRGDAPGEGGAAGGLRGLGGRLRRFFK